MPISNKFIPISTNKCQFEKRKSLIYIECYGGERGAIRAPHSPFGPSSQAPMLLRFAPPEPSCRVRILLQLTKKPTEVGLVLMAEREGFEPSIGDKSYTPLAGARLQPLGHLSKENVLYCIYFS